MKVRHKDGKGYWDVVEESPSYYLIRSQGHHIFDWPAKPIIFGELLALPKPLYEPVPEERWEDVTGQCVAEHASIVHVCAAGEVEVHNAQWFRNGTYRLRKVPIAAYDDGHGWEAGTYTAFIVERKVNA